MQPESFIDFLIQHYIPKQRICSESEKQYWDAFWSREIAYFQEYGESRETRDRWLNRCNLKLVDHYNQLLDGVCGKSIIECGAGSGIISLLLAKLGASVTIVDFSSRSLEYAQLIANQLGITSNVEFLEADIFQLQQRAAYDIAWNCGVVEHYEWKDAVSLVNLMKSLVRPGGSVLVTLPNLLSIEIFYRMLKEGKGSEIYYSRRQLKCLMQEAGLKDIRIIPLLFATPSFAPHFGRPFENETLAKLFPQTSWLFSGIGKKDS